MSTACQDLVVRAMFNVMGGDGHFIPMVPVARGLQAKGHDVVFVTDETYCDEIETRGFRALPAGRSVDDEFIARIQNLEGLERLRNTIQWFLDTSVICAPRLVNLAAEDHSDVLVRETTGWGAWLAGEVLGLPVATFDFSPAPSGLFARLLGDLFQAARAEVNLGPDEGLETLDQWLTIVGAPPGWFPPECFRPTTHLLQPPEDPSDGGSLPQWVEELPDRTTIYVTLGTVFNRTPGLFEMMLEAICDLDANVIMTVGRTLDPAGFGELPDHIHIEQFIPQGLVLDRCDVVIAHGGYGSLMGALRQGLPLVTIPLAAADNELNAARVEQLGAGLAVPEDDRSVEKIRAAVDAVVNDPHYRAAAQRVSADIAGLPPFASAVTLIERLATERRPLLSVFH